jgi:hypothetical protein
MMRALTLLGIWVTSLALAGGLVYGCQAVVHAAAQLFGDFYTAVFFVVVWLGGIGCIGIVIVETLRPWRDRQW